MKYQDFSQFVKSLWYEKHPKSFLIFSPFRPIRPLDHRPPRLRKMLVTYHNPRIWIGFSTLGFRSIVSYAHLVLPWSSLLSSVWTRCPPSCPHAQEMPREDARDSIFPKTNWSFFQTAQEPVGPKTQGAYLDMVSAYSFAETPIEECLIHAERGGLLCSSDTALLPGKWHEWNGKSSSSRIFKAGVIPLRSYMTCWHTQLRRCEERERIAQWQSLIMLPCVLKRETQKFPVLWDDGNMCLSGGWKWTSCYGELHLPHLYCCWHVDVEHQYWFVELRQIENRSPSDFFG